MNARDAHSLIENCKRFRRNAWPRSRRCNPSAIPFTDQSQAKRRSKRIVRKSLGRLHETDRASLKTAMQAILG